MWKGGEATDRARRGSGVWRKEVKLSLDIPVCALHVSSVIHSSFAANTFFSCWLGFLLFCLFRILITIRLLLASHKLFTSSTLNATADSKQHYEKVTLPRCSVPMLIVRWKFCNWLARGEGSKFKAFAPVENGEANETHATLKNRTESESFGEESSSQR